MKKSIKKIILFIVFWGIMIIYQTEYVYAVNSNLIDDICMEFTSSDMFEFNDNNYSIINYPVFECDGSHGNVLIKYMSLAKKDLNLAHCIGFVAGWNIAGQINNYSNPRNIEVDKGNLDKYVESKLPPPRNHVQYKYVKNAKEGRTGN